MNREKTTNKIIDKMIGDLLKKKKGFHLGPYKGISDVFDSDPWFRKFYMEIAVFYGLPAAQTECASKQDRILSAFASVNITLALEEHIKIWHPWWKEKRKVDQELAEEFCRIVYELRGEQIVPLM